MIYRERKLFYHDIINHFYTQCAPEATELDETRMWADAQRDGRPAEYRWHPLFNAAKFG